MTTNVYVDKSSGTFADPLLAFGLAVVLGDVSQRVHDSAAGQVRIVDQGVYYCLECDRALDEESLSRLEIPYTPAVAIRTAKNVASLPADLPFLATVDYERERDRRNEFFELLKGLPADARRAMARREDHPAIDLLRGHEPHEQWDVFRAINPAALPGYNKLMVQWWTIQEGLPAVIRILCDTFAQTPNDLEAARKAWKELAKTHGWSISPDTTALQVYNPSQGKGQNRTKADRLVMDNVKNAFWLVEWLKAVGFYHAALTKQLSGTKDRKTYVAAPTELDLAESDKVMDTFRSSMARAETAVRSDILASLRYTQALLDYARKGEGASLKARLLRYRQPSRVVSGLYSAFYKDLGNAVATMNLSFLGLPGWLHISSDEQKARLTERLAREDKHWKYNPGDVDERMHWADYMQAYQAALEKCSTAAAPWFVVPADNKWYARLAVTNLLLEHLEAMDPQWPAATFDVAEQQGIEVDADVLEAAAAVIRRAPTAAAAPAEPAGTLPEVAKTTPLKGVRKIVSEGMANSVHTTARVTLFREVDAGELARLRQRFADRGLKVSYNDLLVQICAVALREHPEANARLGEGQIEHLGTPLEVYNHPRNLWVAQFIGSHPINVIEAHRDGGGATLLGSSGWRKALPEAFPAHGDFLIGVRPEHVTLLPGGQAGDGALMAEVYTRQILGTDILYEVKTAEQILRAVTPTSQVYEVGQPVAIGFTWGDAFLFDKETGAALQ